MWRSRTAWIDRLGNAEKASLFVEHLCHSIFDSDPEKARYLLPAEKNSSSSPEPESFGFRNVDSLP